jgi:Right handed beta helix region
VRMTPAAATGLAKIVTNNYAAALSTNGPTCGWRLFGLEIVSTNDPTVLNYGILKLGQSSSELQTSLSRVPQDFILDRVYVHGTTTANSVRCVTLNSGRTAVINSWISECHAKGFDSQAIEGWNGPGPYLIENNFLSGAGENVMFGGGDPGIFGLSPSDITIRGNHVWKDPTWKGKWTVKNLFELKNARRVLVENNVFENNWVDGQSGMAIVIKSAQDACGTCTWEGTTDVTFRYNIVRNSPRGFNVQAVDCSGQACVDVHTQRVRAENNLFENIGTFNGTGEDGFLVLLTQDLRDVAIRHNTFVGNLPGRGIPVVMDLGKGQAHNLTITDNVFTSGTGYALHYSGTRVGSESLRAMAGDSWTFARNVIGGIDPQSVRFHPPGNWYPPTIARIGFVDPEGGDFRLSAKSEFKQHGQGGTDPGADLNGLKKRLEGVVVR